MRWWVLMALAGCGDAEPGIDAAPPAFTLHIELSWSALASPDVVAVTVDGAALPADSIYKLDEMYESYAGAVGSYAPRSVVAMTGSGSASSLLQLETCRDVPQDQLKQLGRLIGETDYYAIDPPLNRAEWEKGVCVGVDGTVSAITRRARTR